MKKSDLKDGMIVQVGEDLYLVCDDKFLGLNGYMRFEDYDENLNLKDKRFEKFNINFVYKSETWGLGLKDLLTSTKLLKVIWERKKEIDWNKVPFGTKVVASDFEERLNREYIFVGYKEELEKYPFIVARVLEGEAVSFRYCKIHPDVDIKEEWYK
ncbi:MAG: hypothetical protein E6715_10140 [Clostridium perfringens]|nr:hypothetical protein [Clostridium perfringens]